MRRLVRLWLSAWVNFSLLPLRVATALGLAIALAGLVGFGWVVYWRLTNQGPTFGWGSIMAALLIFSGTQLVLLGLIGESGRPDIPHGEPTAPGRGAGDRAERSPWRYIRMLRRTAALVGAAALIAGLGAATAARRVRSISLATGSGLTTLPDPRQPFFDITKFGAIAGGSGRRGTKRPSMRRSPRPRRQGVDRRRAGWRFWTYTIRLKSRVGLHLATRESIFRAAIHGTGPGQGGGFYDAPEPNLFVGLQDHGHSHWANSLIYGLDLDDVMISGPGLIDGSDVNARGEGASALTTGDPREVANRPDAGVPGRGKQGDRDQERAVEIVFRDFSIRERRSLRGSSAPALSAGRSTASSSIRTVTRSTSTRRRMSRSGTRCSTP